MKKRLFSAIICIVLSMTVLSGGAWAKEMIYLYIADQPIPNDTYWKNNADNSGVEEAADQSSANVYFKADGEDHGTLYLNNLNVSKSTAADNNTNYAIAANTSLTIDLKGDNTLGTADTGEVISTALQVDGDLTFTGDGSLTATASDALFVSIGIGADSITASDSAEISGVSGDAIITNGVMTSGSIEASDSASISGTAGDSAGYGVGIVSRGAISASDNASISGTAGDSMNYSYGIEANDAVTASDNATISGTGGKAATSAGIAPKSDVTASDNAAITGTGGKATDVISEGVAKQAMSAGILSTTAGEMTATDNAEIRGTGGESDTVSYGIYYPDSITVLDDASIKGTGGSTCSDSPTSGSVGILTGSIDPEFTEDALTVSGGTLEGTGGYSEVSSTGLMLGVDGINYTDGVIIAKADETSGEAYAISTHGLILPESYYWRTGERDAFTHSSKEELPLSLPGAYLELRTKLPPTVLYMIYTIEKTDEGFLADGDFERFTGVFVDDEKLEDDFFTVESAEGKTLVILSADYLKTLSKGEHVLQVFFADGYGELKFTVE